MKKVLVGLVLYLVGYAFGKDAGRNECAAVTKKLLPPDSVMKKASHWEAFDFELN